MKLTEAIRLYDKARPARGRQRHNSHVCQCEKPRRGTCPACGSFCLSCGGMIVKGDTPPVKDDANGG